MNTRTRTIAARTLVGLVGLFSARAQAEKSINFKDSSHATDYRFTLIDHRFSPTGSTYSDATKYYQPLFDQVNHGECGADTNLDYIPVHYTLLEQLSRNNVVASFYRGANQPMNQSLEDCLKLLINLSDARYKQYLDELDADYQARKGRSEIMSSVMLSIIGLMLVGVIGTAVYLSYVRIKKYNGAYVPTSVTPDDTDDTNVLPLENISTIEPEPEKDPGQPSIRI